MPPDTFIENCDFTEPDIFIDRLPSPAYWKDDDPLALYSKALTRIEYGAVSLAAAGMDDREISARIRVRIYYVRGLIRSACRKLEIPNKTALILAWQCELFHLGMRELGFLPFLKNSQK